MTFLFVVKQKKNVDTFEGVIDTLLDGGHTVKLAVQERDEERDRRLLDRFPSPRFELVAPPDGRGDRWRSTAPLVRAARDLAQYSRPSYAAASKLRQRAADRFFKALGAAGRMDADAVAFGVQAAEGLRSSLEHLERALPSDPLHEEFLARHAPDAVLVTPGVHFGSVQSDVIKSAQARGIPVWMLLFSWDNLSSKGALHVAPDLLFVWNDRQRLEAEELHDFPPERVVVVGAPRFDEFFTLRSQVPRRDFLAPLGLDPARPVLLYVCSSRFIADRELPFIRQWLAAVRAGPGPLRSSHVIVRPHPDIVLDEETPVDTVTWDGLSRATGWVQRPFDDAGAIILRTTYATPQAFFECLHHAAAVVGLNTSAELEAGIAGRPVLTLLSRESGADGQRSTLHFDYLLRENGGFVACGSTMAEHVEALAATVAAPPDPAAITSFIDAFLRPHGTQPVSALLARTLIERVAAAVAAGAPTTDRSPDQTTPPPDSHGKLLHVHSAGAAARVHVTPETRRFRRVGILHLDPVVVAWLAEHMHPGEVFFDIGAGVGAYTLLAAMERGGLAVAFEPGFASFHRLCDNLLLNGCYRSVIPVPVALAAGPGLAEMVYPHAPGEDAHAVTSRRWRARQDRFESRYTQPVCAERLDDLVARQRLPSPHVVRVNARKAADRVLAGAANVLRQPQLRSVLVSMPDAQVESVLRAVDGLGFAHTLVPAKDGFDGSLCLVRTEPMRRHPLHAVRRAVAGLRSGTLTHHGRR